MSYATRRGTERCKNSSLSSERMEPEVVDPPDHVRGLSGRPAHEPLGHLACRPPPLASPTGLTHTAPPPRARLSEGASHWQQDQWQGLVSMRTKLACTGAWESPALGKQKDQALQDRKQAYKLKNSATGHGKKCGAGLS